MKSGSSALLFSLLSMYVSCVRFLSIYMYMFMDNLTNTFYTCFFDILVTCFSSVNRCL